MSKNYDLSDFSQTPFEGRYAAIYVRVSQNEFEIGPEGDKKYKNSVIAQKIDGQKVCDDNGWEFKIYDKDCNKSGSLRPGKGPKGREDLEKLLKDIQRGKVHTVIVRDVKRLARNARLLKEILEDYLLKYGVNIIGTQDSINIMDSQGRMILGILAEVAQAELNYISVSSQRGRLNAAVEGKLALNPYTYGYEHVGDKNDHGRVRVVENEAEVVRLIFDLYANKKKSTHWIADYLEAKKIPTKHADSKEEGTTWQPSQILLTLRNVRYIGKIKYLGKEYDSPFPRIIDDDLWEKAKAELAKRSCKGRRTLNSKYLLSGILKCGNCLGRKTKGGDKIYPSMQVTLGPKKRPLNPDPRHQKYQPWKEGSTEDRHSYYNCQTHRKHGKNGCSEAPKINREELDRFIKRFICALDAGGFSRLVENEPSASKNIKQKLFVIDDKISQTKGTIERLPDRIAEAGSKVKEDALLKSLDKAEANLKKYRKQKRDLERELANVTSEGKLDDFIELQKWDELDFETRRRLLQEIIPKLVMWKDRFEIYIGNENNKPVVIPYEPIDPRRTSRRLPEIDDAWDLTLRYVDGEGEVGNKQIVVGVPVTVGGKRVIGAKELFFPDKMEDEDENQTDGLK